MPKQNKKNNLEHRNYVLPNASCCCGTHSNAIMLRNYTPSNKRISDYEKKEIIDKNKGVKNE